jgi:hypothetical protein
MIFATSHALSVNMERDEAQTNLGASKLPTNRFTPVGAAITKERDTKHSYLSTVLRYVLANKYGHRAELPKSFAEIVQPWYQLSTCALTTPTHGIKNRPKAFEIPCARQEDRCLPGR